MTPQELKDLALEASKKEFDSVLEGLRRAAKEGRLSEGFDSLLEGTVELLKAAGYAVQEKRRPNNMRGHTFWEVSFK
jgi:hypothetical protein